MHSRPTDEAFKVEVAGREMAVLEERSIPKLWIRPHYASFNGLRALAICLVFLIHYGMYAVPVAWVSDMWVGVDLFFVLSGFLITGILFDSLDDPHFFRNFYMRRALRIFPLFYGFFALIFLLTPVLHLRYHRSLLFYVLYVGNLVMPFVDLSRNNPTVIWLPLGATRHFQINIGSFWTLCVEEQFYILWPVLIWLARSRKRLMRICVLGWSLTILCRAAIPLFAPRLLPFLGWYTYTRIDTLLLGAWLALWLRGQPLCRKQLHVLGGGLLLIGFCGYFSARFLPQRQLTTVYVSSLVLTWVGLAAGGVLLLALDEEGAFARLLRWAPVASLGAVSYGFYFFHGLYMEEVVDLYSRHAVLHRYRWLIAPVAFLVAFVIAKLSFRFYETPFLRLKSKLAPQWTGDASVYKQAVDTARLHVPEPQPR